LHRDIVKGGHNQVRACLGQRFLVSETGDADGCHPARLGRLHPRHGVLNDKAPVRRGAELVSRGQEDHRVRFAAGEVAS